MNTVVMMSGVLVLLLPLCVPVGAESPRDAWVRQLSPGSYELEIDWGREGSPVDLVFIRLSDGESWQSRATERRIRRLFRQDAVVAPGGKSIIVVPGETHYEMHCDEGREVTTYAVNVAEEGRYLLAVPAGSAADRRVHLH